MKENQTAMGNGQKICKDDPLIEIFGLCDEINGWYGLLIGELNEANDQLVKYQKTSLKIPPTLVDQKGQITNQDLDDLKNDINALKAKLPKHSKFETPHTKKTATAHLLRTKIRQLEHKICLWDQKKNLPPYFYEYLNLLSSLIFMIQLSIELWLID